MDEPLRPDCPTGNLEDDRIIAQFRCDVKLFFARGRISLDKLTGKFYLWDMAKKKILTITEFARLGGKARARKYDHATLSRWAKKGGRPPRKGE